MLLRVYGNRTTAAACGSSLTPHLTNSAPVQVNWQLLKDRELDAPWIPRIKDALDKTYLQAPKKK